MTKKEEQIDKVNQLVANNYHEGYYILSIRFTNNNTNGQCNREMGQILRSYGMLSLTGTTTGTAWIGKKSLNVISLQNKLNNFGNNLVYYIFKSTYKSGSSFGDGQFKVLPIKKVGKDEVDPEEDFKAEDSDEVDEATSRMNKMTIKSKK